MTNTDALVAPLVLSRYKQMGIIPGWSRERFYKLCTLMERHPIEVGAFAGLTTGETNAAIERGWFSPTVSLHFAIFDMALREARFGEPSVPIVPLDIRKT